MSSEQDLRIYISQCWWVTRDSYSYNNFFTMYNHVEFPKPEAKCIFLVPRKLSWLDIWGQNPWYGNVFLRMCITPETWRRSFPTLMTARDIFFKELVRWNHHQTTANYLVKGLGWWFATRLFESFLHRFCDLGFIVFFVALVSEAPKKGRVKLCNLFLGGGFQYFLFSPQRLGKIPFLAHISAMGGSTTN